MSEREGVDVLAFGAHPDDVALRIGGTVHKLTSRGYRVVICDLTRGEKATRGTPEERVREAARAAQVLGVECRINLALPDGGLTDSLRYRSKIIEVIRKWRPRLLLCSYIRDLHPDHEAAGKLLCSALYPSGFTQLPVPGEAFRPGALLFYMAHTPFEPAFVVDTQGHFEAKRKAIACYHSQLYDPESPQPPTWVAKPDLLQEIEGRDRYFGSLIGRTHGEPFACMGTLPMDDVVAHFSCFTKQQDL